MADAAEKKDLPVFHLTVSELDQRIEDAVARAVERVMQGRPASSENDILDTAGAAAKMGISPAALRKLVSRNVICPDHRGQRGGLRGNRFTMRTIQAFIERNRAKQK